MDFLNGYYVLYDGPNRITRPYSEHGHAIDMGWRSNEEYNKVYANSLGTVVKVVDGKENTTSDPSTQYGLASYGNYVDVQHPTGEMTRYAHLQNGSILVKEGDTVGSNVVLGIIGNTGWSFGRHLHYETFKGGVNIDPTPSLTTPYASNEYVPQPNPPTPPTPPSPTPTSGKSWIPLAIVHAFYEL